MSDKMTPRAAAIAAPQMGRSDPTESYEPEGVWSDMMPTIPIERGVPVMRAGTRWTAVEDQEGHTGVLCAYTEQEPHRYEVIDVRDLMVDLGTAQGFIYALRFLRGRYPMALLHFVNRPEAYEVMTDRWLRGSTTDRDRILLAAALTEMSRMV